MEWTPLVLSFEIAATATLVAAVTGIALAALLANVRFFGRDVLDVLTTAPMVLPPTVLGYYLLVAVGKNSFIGKAWEGLTGSPIVFTRTGAIIAAVIGAVPFVVKSSRAALEGVDVRLVQAARTLRAGPLRAFFTVQLPLAKRGVTAGLMLGFAKSLGDFGVTWMIGGSVEGKTRTASIAIYEAVEERREADALWMSCVLAGVALVILYGATKLTARSDAR